MSANRCRQVRITNSHQQAKPGLKEVRIGAAPYRGAPICTKAAAGPAMSAEAVAFTRSWKVGAYTATLSVPRCGPGVVTSACIEWDPEMPPRLTPRELEQYRTGRNEAVAAMAQALGIRIGVVDI